MAQDRTAECVNCARRSMARGRSLSFLQTSLPRALFFFHLHEPNRSPSFGHIYKRAGKTPEAGLLVTPISRGRDPGPLRFSSCASSPFQGAACSASAFLGYNAVLVPSVSLLLRLGSSQSRFSQQPPQHHAASPCCHEHDSNTPRLQSKPSTCLSLPTLPSSTETACCSSPTGFDPFFLSQFSSNSAYRSRRGTCNARAVTADPETVSPPVCFLLDSAPDIVFYRSPWPACPLFSVPPPRRAIRKTLSREPSFPSFFFLDGLLCLDDAGTLNCGRLWTRCGGCWPAAVGALSRSVFGRVFHRLQPSDVQ